MKCPYRLRTIVITNVTEEKNNKNIHMHREDYFECICEEENCAAWENGRCNFNKDKGD